MPAQILYHASHEQFAPSRLLAYVRLAEGAGFHGFFSSDHFHPWSEAQGQSGFSWSWLGAALMATQVPGSLICCPGYRYHPAVVAQAAATLCEMFNGRFWMAVGSGEAINEHITGAPWPPKDLRNARLKECADVVRALWQGETVTHRGLVTVEEAKLYTRPKEPPPLVGAAVSPETAEWMGGWVDKLITVSQPPAKMMKVIEAFHRGGGESKPFIVKAGLSYAASTEAAIEQAYSQWRNAAFENSLLSELHSVRQFEAAGARVHVEDMQQVLHISHDLSQHAAWIQSYLDLGAEQVILHNVGTNQEEFIESFGAKVIPALGSAAV